MVFASTRDQELDRTSLWIAKLGVEVVPTRLTSGALDSHPVWNGKSIVFASTRDGGDFDLWQLTPGSDPVQLTTGEHHEVTPSIAPDGAIIYASVDRETKASHLEMRTPDGKIERLTPGPDERDPAISPDGNTIAFISHVERDNRKDAELWVMSTGSRQAKQLVDLPPTDEAGPVWSRDGRYLFATSVLPGELQPLMASVVFIDRDENPRRVRILRDSAGPLARVMPQVATTALDRAALASDPEYLPELANIMARAIERQRKETQ